MDDDRPATESELPSNTDWLRWAALDTLHHPIAPPSPIRRASLIDDEDDDYYFDNSDLSEGSDIDSGEDDDSDELLVAPSQSPPTTAERPSAQASTPPAANETAASTPTAAGDGDEPPRATDTETDATVGEQSTTAQQSSFVVPVSPEIEARAEDEAARRRRQLADLRLRYYDTAQAAIGAAAVAQAVTMDDGAQLRASPVPSASVSSASSPSSAASSGWMTVPVAAATDGAARSANSSTVATPQAAGADRAPLELDTSAAVRAGARSQVAADWLRELDAASADAPSDTGTPRNDDVAMRVGVVADEQYDHAGDGDSVSAAAAHADAVAEAAPAPMEIEDVESDEPPAPASAAPGGAPPRRSARIAHGRR